MSDIDLEQHDPLEQNLDENEAENLHTEVIVDEAEKRAPEEVAVNTDTETAREANERVLVTDDEAALETEAAVLDEEVIEEERKHKNRESTSEKAKKAATARVAKGLKAEPVSKKQLDPLRLRGKKYRAAVQHVDKKQTYPLVEALELVKKTSTSTFDGAVELHIKVKGENLRGVAVLPAGTGKTKRVALADDETLAEIEKGTLNFDVLLATPAQMPKLAKFAKVLGPKGLMPSPKAGTVTEDVEKAKEEIGSGRVEYRADKTGVVHLSIGRISFTVEKLAENYRAITQAITLQRIQSASVASTMGPGVRVDLTA